MSRSSTSIAKVNIANPIRIVIVDDQRVVRERIKDVVAAAPKLKVVGTANNGLKAIAAIESLHPDVVLMDVEMPKLNGIEATKIISQRFANLKILVISTYDKEEYIYQIINAGADGYILKQTPAPNLVEAIHLVYQGYSHFGPKLLKNVRLSKRQNLAESINPQNYPPQQQDANDYCRLVDRPNLVKSKQPASAAIKPTGIDLATSSTITTNRNVSTSNPWLTWGIVASVLFLSSLIPLASNLKHRSIVEADAIVYPRIKTQALQANRTGKIAEILIKPGDTITEGETIATIERSDAKARIANLNQKIAQGQQQLNQLDSRIALLEQQIGVETQSNSAKIEVAEAKLASSKRTYKAAKDIAGDRVIQAQAALQKARADLETAQSKLQRYQSVGTAGGLSQTYLLEAKSAVESGKQEVIARKTELENAIAALNPDRNEIKIARRNIESLKKSGQVAIADLEQEQAALKQQRMAIEHQQEQDNLNLSQINTELAAPDLVATATGKVSRLSMSEGDEIVQKGEEIAQIVAETEDVTLKAAIAPSDLEQITLGLPVSIQVASCLDPDYILAGEVTQVPPYVTEVDDRDRNSRRSPAPPYEIEITPNSSANKQDDSCGLKSAMKTTVEIITREETMLQFILRKARLT